MGCVGFLVSSVADHLFEIAFDGEADGRHGRVGRLVLEGILEVDGHFLDQEEDCGDRDHDGDGHEAEEVDQGEGQHSKEEQQREVDIQAICSGEYGIFYPLAFAHRVTET